jgi:signal transduction histidine kinase
MNRIFDPYFSTKHKSHMHSGTGLGLFIVHQNMRDHGGLIEVKSKVNEGTRFVLELPVDPLLSLSGESVDTKYENR